MSTKKTPGVFSIQRCLNVTDGLMYSLLDTGEQVPLHVMRHGIRGTQNISKEKASSKENSTSASTAARAVSNVQITDTAKTHAQAVALAVEFSLKPIDIEQEAITACASAKGASIDDARAFRKELELFIKNTRDGALLELSARYVRNLVNGRWLWRNRTQSEKIIIEITAGKKGSGQTYSFDALDYGMNTFDNACEKEKELTRYLASGFNGARDVVLNVRALVSFGMHGSIEVFPSQNYLSGKEKGFARSLYCVGQSEGGDPTKGNVYLGHAAIRDQKIGNAIRTIDTWYTDFSKKGSPIPVEPNGANLEDQVFFRTKKDSGFHLMANVSDFNSDAEALKSDAAKFLLACVIRGGVYSEGGE
tara:strand:- start:516 stop:1601 length:1086 start_codon:yes stop_codon:yes gene_type:complete